MRPTGTYAYELFLFKKICATICYQCRAPSETFNKIHYIKIRKEGNGILCMNNNIALNHWCFDVDFASDELKGRRDPLLATAALIAEIRPVA